MDAFNDDIKFRCEKELVARAERLALHRRRKFSDFCRLAFEEYLDAAEKAEGLPPLDMDRLPVKQQEKPINSKPASKQKGILGRASDKVRRQPPKS